MTWLVIERPTVKLYKPFYKHTKRLLELLFCLVTLPILLPFFLVISIIIRLTSTGPIFYTQVRIGKDGRAFHMIKFRTMYHDIDRVSHQAFMKAFVNGKIKVQSEKDVFKPFDSSHVTPIGRILRKTSLDELPQLFNVFRGEMSLVGPRPNVVWEFEEYKGWHKERLEVLPGITGLAQVRGRSGILFDEIVEYDIEYVQNQSLMLDLKILWWTLTSVLMGKGAH